MIFGSEDPLFFWIGVCFCYATLAFRRENKDTNKLRGALWLHTCRRPIDFLFCCQNAVHW